LNGNDFLLSGNNRKTAPFADQALNNIKTKKNTVIYPKNETGYVIQPGVHAGY
jgi:hypothetical protein